MERERKNYIDLDVDSETPDEPKPTEVLDEDGDSDDVEMHGQAFHRPS